MSRSKTRSEGKIVAVEKYKRGEASQSGIAKEYGVDQKTLCAWMLLSSKSPCILAKKIP